MKVFFIGFAVNPTQAHVTEGVSIAGNNMQMGVINGLNNIIKNDLKVFSVRPIAAYPREKRLLVKRERVNLSTEVETTNIPFLNLPVIKQRSISKALFKDIEKEIRRSEDKEITLLLFNAVPFVSIAVNKLARKYKLKSVCMLADPPVDNIKRGIIGTFLRRLRDEKSYKSIKCFNKLIVLNEKATENLGIDIPSKVIDCGIEIRKENSIQEEKIYEMTKEKRIVFTGTIQEHSGIVNLVKAMEYVVDSDAKLYIYGKGPMEAEIKMLANGFNNIIINGFLPYEKIRKIQSESYLLVNPSKVDHAINKVAFPSKLMEYMLSGTPVISNKLDGISKEYIGKIFFFDDDTPQAMGYGINKLLAMDYIEYNNIADKAKSFIIKNKDWNEQSRKILAFINEK